MSAIETTYKNFVGRVDASSGEAMKMINPRRQAADVPAHL